MKIKKHFIILIIIFFLGLILRTVYLIDYPVGFHIDEASLGYNAYSILKTGKDEWGNFLPLHFKAFGDWPPAGYLYLTAFCESFLGLTEIAVRLPSAIVGSLTVILIYLFVNQLFKDKNRKSSKIALLSSFFLAICPWHITLSRSSSEDIVSNFLILLGLFFLLKENKIKNFILSILSFLLSFYFYFSSRVLVPLLLFDIGFFYFKNKQKKKAINKLLVIILSFLTITTLFGKQTRFKTVSIFFNLENKLIVEEQIKEDEMFQIKPFTVRFFHNKLIRITKAFLSQYGKYFSMDFLFLKGGLPERYKIQDSGLLLITTLPLILAGLFYLIRKFNLKENQFLFLCLFIAAIPAALTYENTPNVRRSSFLIFGFVILQAFGWEYIGKIFNGKIINRFLKLIILVFIFLEFSLFIHNATVHAKAHRPWYRNYGYKQMIKEINKIEKNYSQIYVTEEFDNDPYIFFLFYNKIDPNYYQKFSANKPARLAGDNKERWEFDKYIFVRDKCPCVKEKKSLIIARGDCQTPENFKSLKKIYRLDGTLVFHLYSYEE